MMQSRLAMQTSTTFSVLAISKYCSAAVLLIGWHFLNTYLLAVHVLQSCTQFCLTEGPANLLDCDNSLQKNKQPKTKMIYPNPE